MGVSIQQWRATIGQWSDGRLRKCVTVAHAIARKRQQDFHKWFRLLVLVSLLVIGCVELNPGPNKPQETSATPQHGATLPKYKKRPGTVGLHGQLYERRVASYLFARGLNKTKEFRLASNLDGAAGVFDDLVFRYRLEEQDVCKTCFIQLKHKDREYTVQRTSLKQLSGDFSLFRYFESYCDIKRHVCTDRNLKHCGPFDEFEFVIYTNAKLESNSVVKFDDTNPVSILGSGPNSGEYTSFDEDRDKDIFDFFQELSEYDNFISELGDLLKGGACEDKDMLDRIEKFRNSITSAEISGKLNNLKREPRVVEKFMKELDKCEFSLCTEFLQKVKIFQCQSNEKSLETLIKKELREACQTSDLVKNNFIYEIFQEGVMQWWKRKGKTEWLNKRSRVWQNVKENIIKTIKQQREDELRETQGYGIRFKEQHIKQLSDAIQDSSFLNIITDTNVGSISKLKTFEAINSIRCKNSLFVCLKSLLKRRKEILNFWPCKWSTLLVIDCTRGADNVDENVANILLDYLRKPHKKLILISQRKHQNFASHLNQNLGHVCKYDEYSDEYSFLDLDDESQEQILERTVIFQGTEVALKELVGNDPHDNLKRNIDSHVMSRLLDSKQKLNIGKNLGDFSDFYVPRTLDHRIYLNEHILRTTDNTITFVITGLKAHQLKNYLPPGEKICRFKFDRSKNSSCFKVINDFTTSGFNAELGDKEKRHNMWKSSKPEDIRFIILGEKHAASDFSILKTLYNKVHWVQMKDGSFLWRESNCDIGVIRRHIDNTKYESYSSRNIMEHTDNVLLLAAEPGMGKSTFLSFMELEMKKCNPSVWVLRLNLHEHTRALEDIEFERESIDKCYNFLWNAAHSPEQDGFKLVEIIFRQALEQTGNMVVILDGFDEISPDYSCKVEKLIREMTDRMKSKIWVSSRFSYRVKLEDIMTRFAFTLQPFTQKNQISCLEQYWSRNIQRPKQASLRDFAQELLRLSSRNFSDKDGQFTGIPLQTMMLGEAFTKEAVNYCSSGKVNLPENFNLLALFKKFTEKKCDIYFNEKNLMDCSKPKARMDKELCINKHKISALMSLFSSDEFNQLLEAGNANDLQSTVNFLKSREAERYGIITEFVDSKPRFIHRCFAEYFAAKWFAENFAKLENFILKHLFNYTFEVVRNIFDRILAEDILLHGAVLNNDMQAINELLKKGTDVNRVDKGGRTALHLAATYKSAVTQALLSVPGVDINATDSVLKWTPLRYADRTRSWMAIDILLQAGGKADDVVFTSKNMKHQEWGQAALWECAQKGHKKLLEFMLNSGTDVNTVVRVRENLQQKHTLLHIASRYGQLEMVRFLLERRADINIRDARNNSAVHIAAFTNGADIITLLLDRGASANVTNAQGCTPLHFSAPSGHLEATMTLIKRRVALDKPNKMGETPLMLAAYSGRLEIVSFLIQNGSDINLCVANRSALSSVIEGGHLDVIRFLLENGADINGRNVPRGLTPLQIATFKQNLSVVKCLIERGADVNLCSRDEASSSALHVAVSVGNWEILDYLIRADADLNIRDNAGQSPLCLALLLNKTELAINLIKKGANVNIPDIRQFTPLYYAALNDNLECTKCLVQFGANVNHKGPRDSTALSMATQLERICIINVLVENYADINLRDDLGNTALHVAVGKGNPSLVHYLLDRGADINIPNSTGHTPLYWIVARGWDFLVDHSLHARWSQPVLPMPMQVIEFGFLYKECVLNRQ